ncbi:ABCB family ABC transporter ATP-binding protein/permease [Granulosicoccus sp. 3-233]|uniref:ABCB family ABC transporter ATP-binding protein/permease n=1 Tax=Granulosicoccus sp. 3-233 TaxID=3417969 RepID=UPI003D3543F8
MAGREEAPHSNRRDIENLKKLSTYLWEYRGRVLVALGFLMLSKLAIVAVPLVLKRIINTLDQTGGATGDGNAGNTLADSLADPLGDPLAVGSNEILLVGLGLVAAYGLLRMCSSLFTELRDSLFARVRYRAMQKLSSQVLTQLHDLSLAFHLERRTGSIAKDLSRGTSSLSSIVNLLVFNIVPTAAEFLLVAAILLGGYGWHYTAVVFGTVIIYVAFTLFFSGWRMQFRHEMNRMDSLASGRAVDSLLNYETVKYFNNEKREIAVYEAHMNDWANAGVRSQVTMSTLNFGQAAIVSVGVTLIMMLAVRDVTTRTITLGDIVLINAMMLQLFVPLNYLGVVYRGLQYALADMDLVLRLLERTPQIQDKPGAKPLEVRQARIEFRDVRFAYLPERPILRGVSFTVEPGSKVAVVGPSGAGKSTLSRLLFRFYDVDDGQVLIDGVDVRDCTQSSLREALGVVPQDTVMFNDTIRYNLAYAHPEADDERVTEAARRANLESFIRELPQGYDTVVGERGLKLSGGEKQRMAIARVVVKDPPIIIFDEATSSLDTRSEQAILEGMNAVARRATSLVIAHRLSTVVDADQIIVLDAGQVVEQGTHEQLLEADGLYADLWQLQLGADDGEGE